MWRKKNNKRQKESLHMKALSACAGLQTSSSLLLEVQNSYAQYSAAGNTVSPCTVDTNAVLPRHKVRLTEAFSSAQNYPSKPPFLVNCKDIHAQPESLVLLQNSVQW
jgi:hypothetical protein